MNVHLTSAYPISEANFGPQWLVHHSDPLEEHRLVGDPNEADLVIFVENHPGHDRYFLKVIGHPLRRRDPQKCVLYHDADRSVTCMRTISPSIERWQFDPRSKQPFHYIARLCENEAVNRATPAFSKNRRYLASFVGSARTHPIRKRLLELESPLFHLQNTGGARAWEMTVAQKENYERDYLEALQESYFVLCPRGVGPATYRLYETMQLGRVPVIISDEFIPDPSIPWEEVAVFIDEKEVDGLEERLLELKDVAVEMGVRSRAVWEAFCAPRVSLKRLIEKAEILLQHAYGARSCLEDLSQFRRQDHWRGILRHAYRLQRKKAASSMRAGKA